MSPNQLFLNANATVPDQGVVLSNTRGKNKGKRGYWLLVNSYLLLVAGCWSLVTSCWLLGGDKCELATCN